MLKMLRRFSRNWLSFVVVMAVLALAGRKLAVFAHQIISLRPTLQTSSAGHHHGSSGQSLLRQINCKSQKVTADYSKLDPVWSLSPSVLRLFSLVAIRVGQWHSMAPPGSILLDDPGTSPLRI